MKTLIRSMLCFLISTTLIHSPMTYANTGMISTADAVMKMTRGEGEITAQAQHPDSELVEHNLSVAKEAHFKSRKKSWSPSRKAEAEAHIH